MDSAAFCHPVHCPDPSGVAPDQARPIDSSADSRPAAAAAITCFGELLHHVPCHPAAGGLDLSSHWAVRLCGDGREAYSSPGLGIFLLLICGYADLTEVGAHDSEFSILLSRLLALATGWRSTDAGRIRALAESGRNAYWSRQGGRALTPSCFLEHCFPSEPGCAFISAAGSTPHKSRQELKRPIGEAPRKVHADKGHMPPGKT